MMNFIAKYFDFSGHNTNFKQEIIGGATTFFTMAYIIIVNPKILEAAGMPFEASMVATIISAVFGTLAMGIFAKRPIAIAPYMGENAFIAYTVVGILGYSWQTALGAIFISGVLFTILTLLRVRQWLANAIPHTLKIAFGVGIGLFLTFIGLNETGIVRLGVENAPVKVGDFHTSGVIFALFSLFLITILMMKKIKGAILIGILVTSIIAFITGYAEIPAQIISMPPDISPVFMQLDIMGALSWGFFAVIFSIFVMDFVDTMGTLIGVSYKAGLLDENGNIPDIEKPMLADAVSTIAGSIFGTTTSGAYIESATGIEAGAKTGFANVVTAILFFSGLFFAPIFIAIPAYAYGPALIIVGILMMTSVSNLNLEDYSESLPFFLTIILMSFTFNIGIGITAGFVSYPLLKIFQGRYKEISAGLWVLGIISLMFFIFYPY